MKISFIHKGQSILRTIAYNALIIFVLLPGVRAIFKYLPEVAWLISFAGLLMVMVVSNLYCERLSKLFGNRYLIIISVTVVTIVVYFMYPFADGLKAVMRGSDEDDAVILGVLRLLQGENPYLDLTYLGNPSSTGFGVFLYYLPFVLFNAYSLGGIIAIGVVMAALVHTTGRLEDAGFFFYMLFSCVAVPELLVVGSDLIFVGSGIALLVLLVRLMSETRIWRRLVILAILCGVLASSRVNFLVLVPLVGFLLFSIWRSGAVVFVVLGSIVALLPSAIIYISDTQAFTPLHLLHTAQDILPTSILVAAAFVSMVMTIVGFILVRSDAAFFPLSVFLALLPALATLSIGDLCGVGGDFALWGGSTYLIPLVPLAAILVMQLRQSALVERSVEAEE